MIPERINFVSRGITVIGKSADRAPVLLLPMIVTREIVDRADISCCDDRTVRSNCKNGVVPRIIGRYAFCVRFWNSNATAAVEGSR